MTLASITEIRPDPRCVPGAYITLDGGLYEVCSFHVMDNHGLAGGLVGKLRVINSSTHDERWLTDTGIRAAKLVREAPEPEEKPSWAA